MLMNHLKYSFVEIGALWSFRRTSLSPDPIRGTGRFPHHPDPSPGSNSAGGATPAERIRAHWPADPRYPMRRRHPADRAHTAGSRLAYRTPRCSAWSWSSQSQSAGNCCARAANSSFEEFVAQFSPSDYRLWLQYQKSDLPNIKVIRFERINSDFKAYANEFGFRNPRMPHLNASGGETYLNVMTPAPPSRTAHPRSPRQPPAYCPSSFPS